MRFVSNQGSGASEYAAAGRNVAQAASQLLKTAHENSPDYSELSEQAMNVRSLKEIAATRARAEFIQNALPVVANTKRQELQSSADVISEEKKLTTASHRMAGKIAAMIPSLATTSSTQRYKKRPQAPAYVDYSEEIKEIEQRIEKNKNRTKLESQKTDKVNTNSDLQIALSSDEKAALDYLGKYESDNVGGYNAINQIGIKGGHGVKGYSGDITKMSQHGGRPLTDFTTREIMDLQANNNNMSDQEWINSGRLHAVGRYQFIGPTLASEVKRQGIDPDAKFTPELQDKLALGYLRHAGGISPWVGPSTYATPEERETISRVARSKPSWLQSQNQLTPTKTSTELSSLDYQHKPIEYFTGDRNHSGFRPDHGGSNYHDHIAFSTTEERDAAIKKLTAAGITIGSVNDGEHAPKSYHYANLAFDIPGTNWKVGEESKGSEIIRKILNI